MNALKEGILNLVARISSIGFFDVLDIAIVSIIFYYTYRFVRDRRAGKLALGILLVILALFISNILGMQALSYLIENIVQVGMIGDHIVIGHAKHLVAAGLVAFLYLFDGHFAVGDGAMGVEICFEVSVYLGQ